MRSSYRLILSAQFAPRLALGMIVFCLSACEGGPEALPEGAWPYAPLRMVFHGLSRFVERDGEERLSLRVEFFDAEGHNTKFAGILDLVVDPEGTRELNRDFQFDLSKRRTNRAAWDHVTETYRFELDLDWSDPPLPATPIRVRGIARSADTPELRAGITLRRAR